MDTTQTTMQRSLLQTMNKEKLYQKIQALFPPTLGVGDVVEGLGCEKYRIIQLWGKDSYRMNNGYVLYKEHIKLIRKNITLPMVLEAMEVKVELFCTKKGYGKQTIKEAQFQRQISIMDLWQLHKNNTDCTLYDQSEKLIKLVYEVLK